MSRLLIAIAFLIAIALGAVGGYLSVKTYPPAPAASMATEPSPAATVPQASDDGDYGPDWPVCRDMSNDPMVRFRACDNVLARGELTTSHQSWALNNRGTANLGMNNVEAAVKDYTTAAKIDPTNASPYLNLANIALQSGRITEALELADKAIALSPSEYGYCARAAALRDLGRAAEGLAAIDAAEKLGPLSDCSKLVRADLLEVLGQNGKALLALADVGEDDRTASHAACRRARLQAEAGKLRAAYDLYAEGMRRDPANNCAAINTALYAPYVMPFADALVVIKEAMQTHPGLPELNCQLGRVYEMQGDLRQALTAYTVAIERAPRDPCGYILRAKYWAQLGDLTAALKDYDGASRLPRQRSDTWKGRAEVLAKLGRNQDALASYDRALALEPNNVDAMQGRGNLRLTLQFYPQAIADFTASVSLQPDASYAHYRLALANVAAMSPVAAIAACGKLAANDVWEDACRLVSAEAMLMGGDPAGAIAKLKGMPAQSPMRPHSELMEVSILLMTGDIDAARALIGRYRATYPAQLYGAVWAALVALASDTPIPADIKALSAEKDIWPMPVLHWLVYGGDPAGLLTAAETPDPQLSRQRQGEAAFYLGVGAMLAGDEHGAASLFSQAAKTGYSEQPKDSYPESYSLSNGREFAIAAWAASGGR